MDFKEWCDEIESLGGETEKMNPEWLNQSYRKGLTPRQVVFGPAAAPTISGGQSSASPVQADPVDPRHWKILKVIICVRIIRVAAYLQFAMATAIMLVAVRTVIAFEQLPKAPPSQSVQTEFSNALTRDYSAITSGLYLLATSVVAIFCASFGAILLLISYFVQRNKHWFEPV